MDSRFNGSWYTLPVSSSESASMKTEEKFIFLLYELFLGLSRGEREEHLATLATQCANPQEERTEMTLLSTPESSGRSTID